MESIDVHSLPKISLEGRHVINMQDGAPRKAPGLARRVKNFARATAKHLAAGAPQATDEQVAQRWAICSSNQCGLFESTGDGAGRCLHSSCGCRLRAIGNESTVKPQKLRWADQACPVGLWTPVI